jgi:hypothetical protein
MLAGERAVAESGLPWTTLRATQFFDALAGVGRAMAKLPVVPVASGVRFQPVDTGEVAGRLAELALGAPAGLVPDFAGPVATAPTSPGPAPRSVIAPGRSSSQIRSPNARGIRPAGHNAAPGTRVA